MPDQPSQAPSAGTGPSPTDPEPLPGQTCPGELPAGQSVDALSFSSEIQENDANDETNNDDTFTDLNISSLLSHSTCSYPLQDQLVKLDYCNHLVCLFVYIAATVPALHHILKYNKKEGVQEENLELTYGGLLTMYFSVCLFTYLAIVCTAVTVYFTLFTQEDNKEGVQEEYLELTQEVDLELYQKRGGKLVHKSKSYGQKGLANFNVPFPLSIT